MTETEARNKLDRLCAHYIHDHSWQLAVQNRVQAASLAYMRGSTDSFRQNMQQAIQLAQEHGLIRLEIDTRIRRFTYMLLLDHSGQILDELRGELDCELGPTGAELTGSLSAQLERRSADALAACDALAANLGEPAPSFLAALQLARQQAEAFSLVHRQGEFQEALGLIANNQAVPLTVIQQVHDIAAGVRSEIALICQSLRIELLLLAADFRNKLGDADTAEDVLMKAEQLSEELPEKCCRVHLNWADHCDRLGNQQFAISHARKAVKASEQIELGALKTEASNKLNQLLARSQEMPGGPFPTLETNTTDQVMRGVDAAHQALLAHRFEDSLKQANAVLGRASSPGLRRAVLRERAIALFELERFTEAEADWDECIALLSAELSADSAVAAGELDSRTKEEEDLYLMKAWLPAKVGRVEAAWQAAEEGRSRRLKREIIAARNSSGCHFDEASFGAIRGWLHAEHAAMLTLATTHWGTLVLTAGPNDTQPQAQFLDQFTGQELRRLLDSEQELGSEAWTSTIFGAIPGLSSGLIHPLLPRLREITKQAKVLFIIPDWLLFNAPFAALQLDGSSNGPIFMDLCPLAVIPSATILLWCASRRGLGASRNCLAVAGLDFHSHLDQISSVPWPTPPFQLRAPDATAAAVATQAPHYTVLYFSCHGTVSSESRDVLESSQLELAGRSRLTARDVSTWKLCADLVFLNACQSGRFRPVARSEVNGFLRAFLLGGARSLIAPLTHVDPRLAGDLAEEFFRAWLTGGSKANALHTAQIVIRKKYPDRLDWAAYCLFGDFT
jgi:tetratricopeptide (TPR) repeat protein